MARMDTSGIDSLLTAMQGLEKESKALQIEIMDEAAKIVKKEVEQSIVRMGHVDSGAMLASIRIEAKTGRDGAAERIVTPSGRDKKGVNNGYKAFVVNYGSSKLTGSRFWNQAEEKARPQIERIAENKVNLEHKKKGL